MSTRLRSLIREIHRRSVWQVLGVYLAGSWVALEVVGGIVESAGLPEWLPGMALVLLVLGLPIVLATAFVQEGAPSGIRSPRDGGEAAGAGRSTDAQPHPRPASDDGATAAVGRSAGGASMPLGRLGSLLTWRNAIGGGVAALALWGVVATGLLLTGAGASTRLGEGGDPARASVAVLPFANMGGEDNEAFTAGLHDELLTQLSRVSSIDVISRTSVMEYRDTRKNIRDIADELGAEVILEGSVQRVGGELRFIAQLIDASTDRHLWAESFDEALTDDRVFHVQSDLAGRVAEALRATLSPEEAAELADAPTDNPEAYRLLLRGNAYFALGPRADSFPRSIELYRVAAEVDPGFALAYARLARAHGTMFQTVAFGDTAHLRSAREAAARALELDPDLGEARLALGELHYWAERDYARSLSELSRARDAGLRSADLYHALGAVQRRMDDWDASIESFGEAVRLDPRSAHYLEDVCDTYQAIGRLPEARDACERAMDLEPDAPRHAARLAYISVLEGTDPGVARAELLERVGAGDDADTHAWLAWLDRDYARVLELEADGALRAHALDGLGRSSEARAYWEGELTAWTPPEEGTVFASFAHMERAWSLAGSGRTDEALEAARRALEVTPLSRDALQHRSLLWDAARVRSLAGDVDGAVSTLERLKELGSEYTPALLRAEPLLDPLREDARFRALVEG
ncbi:MAG TPA: hypothetical protein VML95_02190 [Longimicrobiales bacterium]|nr:hypothetical protein [Longimicrobiales bacterium]